MTSNLLLIYGIGAAVGPAIGGFSMSFFGRYSLFGLFVAGGLFLSLYAWYYMKHGTPISAEDKTHYAPYLRTSQVAVALESHHDGADTEPGE